MDVSDALMDNNFGKKVLSIISSLPDGQGLTKKELAERFNLNSAAVVEKWCLRYPEIASHKIYIPINNGKHRMAVFVNQNYKQQLITNGLATENY